MIYFGVVLSALVSLAAWRLRALSVSGACAAFVTGIIIFGLGGIPWSILLLVFFISSSILSKLSGKRKASLSEKYAKGTRRDWGQVLANGGLGASFALAHYFLPNMSWLWIGYLGAMAAVNADTWATELGVFSVKTPRLITSGKDVEPGTSGGITWVGYLAAFGGAFVICGCATLFFAVADRLYILLAGVLGGLAGSSFDSLLGATVQAIYYCPDCHKETEQSPQHRCGAHTVHIRGWGWLNNDWVNLACSLVGAAVTLLVWLIR